MNDNDFWFAVPCSNLSHDIGFPTAPLRKIREKLLVQGSLRRKVEPRGDVRKEELQKLLEKGLQEHLE